MRFRPHSGPMSSETYFEKLGCTAPWYSALNNPRGLYLSDIDETWLCWEGWNGTNRTAMVSAYSHARNTWGPRRTVGINPLIDDDHGTPAIHRLGSGYGHCIFGSHAGPFKHYKTDAPSDITLWTQQSDIGSGLTYPHINLVTISGTEYLYLFCRYLDTIPQQEPLVLFISSAPDGTGAVTWGSMQRIADCGAVSRTYPYTMAVVGTKVHILIGFANFTDTYRRNGYYLIYDATNGSVSNIDSSTTVASGSLPLDLTTLDTSFRVIDQSGITSINFNEPHFCRDSNGDPHFIWFDLVPLVTGDPYGLYHKAYISGSFTSAVLIDSFDTYVPDSVIIPLGSGQVQVYYSKQNTLFNPFAGNIMTAIRSAGSGGTFAASSLVASSTPDWPLGIPDAILQPHADLRVVWSEENTHFTDPTTSSGTLKGYAYGDSGLLGGDFLVQPTSLLGSISEIATCALSTRKLRDGYTGYCMRVRRSSDDTTQDIGFVGNDLDTASLLTFVGAGNGFVSTWYDQSKDTSGRNGVQATNGKQPQIVASGSLITLNGNPTLKFTEANQTYLVSSGINFLITASAWTVLASFQPTTISGTSDPELTNQLVSDSGAFWYPIGFITVSGTPKFQAGGYDGADNFIRATIALNTKYVGIGKQTGGNIYGGINGGTLSSTSCGSIGSLGRAMHIGGTVEIDTHYFDGYCSEVLVYNTALSSADLNAIGGSTNISAPGNMATYAGVTWSTVP